MNGFVNVLIRVFASISLVAGFFCIVASLAKEDLMPLLIGVGCLINFSLMFGFSFIVEAACKYLDRCEREEMAASTENEE